MRLGGPLFAKFDDPDGWLQAIRDQGYGAATCPVGPDADEATVKAYGEAAAAAGVVIAEVGAWSNPISPDDATREAAMAKCIGALDLADRIGARCCVNIAGSRGEKWDGPCLDDLADETFDLIVETVRKIIDAVKPTRSYYTLETMPWMYPDSPESYLQLIGAIDRPGFAVHLDPVNLVCSPQRYVDNAALIRRCFRLLGNRIRSCHAKDILLGQQLTVHLDEVRPGTGNLAYDTFLRELDNLDPDTPLMLEHLPSAEEYATAAEHLRSVARQEGLEFIA